MTLQQSKSGVLQDKINNRMMILRLLSNLKSLFKRMSLQLSLKIGELKMRRMCILNWILLYLRMEFKLKMGHQNL